MTIPVLKFIKLNVRMWLVATLLDSTFRPFSSNYGLQIELVAATNTKPPPTHLFLSCRSNFLGAKNTELISGLESTLCFPILAKHVSKVVG